MMACRNACKLEESLQVREYDIEVFIVVKHGLCIKGWPAGMQCKLGEALQVRVHDIQALKSSF